jgi:hypothetical protein
MRQCGFRDMLLYCGARFGDTLIITPAITIRDRLRVLLPNDAENYYSWCR